MKDIKKLLWMFGLGALFMILLAGTKGVTATNSSQPNTPPQVSTQESPLFVNSVTGDIVRLSKDGEVPLDARELALLPKDNTDLANAGGELTENSRGGGRGGGFHRGGFHRGGFRGGFHRGRGWGRGFYPYYPYYPYCNPLYYPFYCY